MEITENAAENSDQDEQEKRKPKKKRGNPFNANRKEDKEKRRLRRARIIIRNISYKATDDTLRDHFAKFGTITEVNLLKRPDGKLVGCAFIQYEKVNEAAKAILQATNKDFLGRNVYVDWAVGKDEFTKKKEEKTKVEPKEEEVDVKSEDDDDEVKEESDEENSDDSVKEESDEEDSDASVKEESDDEDEKMSDIKTESPEKTKPKRVSNDIKEGCTVFIKNIPFDATTDDLRKCCRKFGLVYYALINTDPVSGHSRGTGFVKFKTKESADLCLNAGDQFALFDTVMEPHPALTREDVRARDSTSQPTDTRNLYLVKEGLIMSGSKASEGVSASDMSRRHKLEQVKTQILKNLNRFVSRNRLSIHNLPFHVDDDRLRKLVIKYTELQPHECRVMRENMPSAGNPKGKSKGFGFMSFKTHQNALTALRKLNNNPTVFSSANRPIVAFSIEDRSVHNIKEKRLQRSQQNNPTYKDKLEKLKAKKKKKKADKTDDKSKVQKEAKKPKPPADPALDDFVGMPSKPGTFIRMRSNRKIKEQSLEHTKHLSEEKRKNKLRKEKRMHRIEKKQIDRPKMGKRKAEEKDNFSVMVNKYKQLLDTKSANETAATTSKRAKWFVD